MKRVKSLIKLTNRNSESLNEKELSQVIGGHCACGCLYADCMGSSTEDNCMANEDVGLHSVMPPFEIEWHGVY